MGTWNWLLAIAAFGLLGGAVSGQQPPKEPVQKVTAVNKLLAQATQMSQAGNHEGAVQILKQATQQLPQSDVLWARLGDLELLAGKTSTDRTKAKKFYQDAASHYKKAIEGRYFDGLREAYARSDDRSALSNQNAAPSQGESSSAVPSQLDGKWLGPSNSGEFTWLEIHSGGGGISVTSAFGTSSNLQVDGSTLTASFPQSVATRTLRLSLQPDGRLIGETRVHFTDRGRQDYDLPQYFYRAGPGTIQKPANDSLSSQVPTTTATALTADHIADFADTQIASDIKARLGNCDGKVNVTNVKVKDKRVGEGQAE